jgi:hypothetical protein
MALTTRSSRRGPGSPGGPVRYGPVARLADRFSGRADGKRGIPPAPPDAGAGAVRTAHTMRLDQLRSARNDGIYRERQRFLTSTATARDELADVRAALVEAGAALRDVEEQIEEQPGQDENSLVLRTADGPATPEQITRYRRSREQAARTDGLRTRRDALREQERRFQQGIDRLEGHLDEREALSRASAMRLVEHTRRRIATYWYSLTRHHPDGGLILASLNTEADDRPSWLDEAAGRRAYVGERS